MNRLTESEIHALIVLLGDEDEWTASVARDRLLEAGPAVLPKLQEAANANDIRLRARARNLLETLRLNNLRDRFRMFSYRPDHELDLLDGAFLVAEIGYPGLDRSRSLGQLAQLERDIREELRGRQSPYEALGAINRVLFVQYGFGGNSEHYYDPDNSFINRVLERRTGNPISLSVLYIVLARRVGLPVEGVGMPGHFIVKFNALEDLYVDPFNRGHVLSTQDCIRFLVNAGYGYEESYLLPVGVRSIIARMLVNLTQIYSQLEDHQRASLLTEYFHIVLGRNMGD